MKLRAFYLILLVALCVSLLPGCSAFAGKAAIGVIETSGSDATSQIVLFDKDLNKVSGFPLAEEMCIRDRCCVAAPVPLRQNSRSSWPSL